MQNADALKELAWMATAARDAAEFRAAALDWVDRVHSVDAAILLQLDDGKPGAHSGIGPRADWIDLFVHEVTTRYVRDFQAIMESIDGGFFMSGTMTRLENWAAIHGRQGAEEDLMFPLGLRIGSGGLIQTRGAPNGVLLLARLGRTREFTAEEADLLASAAPIISLGLMMHERRPPPPAELPRPLRAPKRWPLTARERSVIEYAVLGLSTREIGLALGTSPNTIRNQLASIFQKLAVASRAELVAVALREGLVDPPRAA